MLLAHRNHAGWERSKKVQQPMPLEPFAKHNRSRFILPGKPANGLDQINTQNLEGLAHRVGAGREIRRASRGASDICERGGNKKAEADERRCGRCAQSSEIWPSPTIFPRKLKPWTDK
ncbi:hypothetical protein [Thioclava sp. JM3]|uniref:hypothetical protein n=1 Tax=Thioclava sp. JM3 TaxID=1973004 RepID=UPI00117CD647|nr:hypothetical protein [Thioclava sp. JM3]